MVLISSRNRSSPSATIFSGVSAIGNRFLVALLTPASVAWADNATATSKVYGLKCSSSLFGSGLALRNRSKASRTSASVQGFVLAGTLPLPCGFVAVRRDAFATALLAGRFFGLCLPRAVRVVFLAMV